jgi:predicted acyltransferase (DUF342 family)
VLKFFHQAKNFHPALLDEVHPMIPTRQLLLTLSLVAAASTAKADPYDLEFLMGSTLYEQAVFANTYVVAGAGPSAALAAVAGHETVYGDILANGYVTLGASSTVTGSVQTGSNLTTGASAAVAGNTLAVGATTFGASSVVAGSVLSGGIITLGASSDITGNVQSGSAIVNEAGATSGTQILKITEPAVADLHQSVGNAQIALDALTGGTALVASNAVNSVTLTAGIYDVTGSMAVAADQTITLDAQGQDSVFIFNVSDYLVFGAGVDVVVANGTDKTRVIWNATGNYVSIGAGTNIIGTILAHEYIVTGAASTVRGAGDSCGGVYSATSYVSIGAASTIGTSGPCGAAAPPADYSNPADPPPVFAAADVRSSGFM